MSNKKERTIKFKVVAELESQSPTISGSRHTIFAKEINHTISEQTVIDLAFAAEKRNYKITHNGMELLVRRCYGRRLHAYYTIDRSECSLRVFKRLQELGWKFLDKAAEKMNLPPRVGPMDDRFMWERLAA